MLAFRPALPNKLATRFGSLEIRIHLLVTALTAGSLWLDEPRTTLEIGGVLCLISYVYLGIREARKAPLRLSPLSFYFFWYCIGMGVSPLCVAVMNPGNWLRFASPGSMVSLESLAIGYVVSLIGSFALHFGIQMFRPSGEVETESANRPGMLRWFVAVWVVGVIFQLSPASFSFLGGTAKIFSVAAVGSVCGFAITRRQKFGLSRSAFSVLLVLGTGGLFFGNLASFSKAYIMFSFLPIIWFFIVRPKLLWCMPVLALVFGVFYLALVAPVVYTARQNPLQEGDSAREHLIATFETWRKDRPGEIDETFFADQLDQFVNRQFDAMPVGYIVGEVQSKGLLLGETMEYASYAFIPRLVWPDKPTVTRGAWFGTYLGMFQSEEEATTSIGMTAIGELYWNFGVWGVLLGMLAIGCLLGYLWRLAGADPRARPIHMLLYVSVMLSMSDMPEAITVFVSVALTFLTFKSVFLILDLLNRGVKKSSFVSLKSDLMRP